MYIQRTRNTNILIFVIIPLFCIQDVLQNFISVFRYMDELFAASIFVLFFFELVRRSFIFQFQTNTLIIITFLAGFLVVGCIATILNGSQPISNVCMDAFVWMKFICAIAVGYLLGIHSERNKGQQSFIHLLDLITFLLFMMFLVDAVFRIFPSDIRLGLRSVKLFYGSYSAFLAAMCFLSAIYLRLYEILKEKVLIRLIPLWILMFFTLRFKAICAVFFMIFIFVIVCQNRRMIGAVRWGIIGSGVALIGFRAIIYYYVKLGDESARSALLSTAFKIVRDYFPLGTGFATFGSAFSTEPYSKIYKLYHIDQIWGLSESYNSFISDSFWPYLLGETGVLGAILYIVVLCALFWRISRLKKINAYTYASAMVCFIYLVISSMGESAFANTFSVYLGFWIGIAFSEEAQGYEYMELYQNTTS